MSTAFKTHERAPRPSARIVLTLLITAVGMALAPSCGRAPARSRPNIVLITVDALRPDHLGCYGYERPTSPFIDSLAARGHVFENCYSSSSWTPPAMASLFTSVYPSSHGVKHGLAMARAIHGQELLDDSFATLAEVLRDNGYKTFGVSGNAHVSESTGMAQGFDSFAGFWFCEPDILNDAALEMAEQMTPSQPWFFWIHYMDPHSPFQPRKPWIDSYARHPELIAEWGARQIEQLREQQKRIEENPAILETLVDLYDGEINYTDDFIRQLFSEAFPTGNTLVVICADHGEAFMDHGFLGHARTLFREEIRIPLVIVPPGGAARPAKSSAEASIIDVYPTILDYAGIKPPEQCRGISLRGAVEGRPPETGRPVFSEFDRGLPQQCIMLDGWKLTVCGTERTRILANLAVDPKETQNLADSEPAMAKRLSDELERWRARTPLFAAPKGETRLTPEQEELMKSLGYLK